MTYFSAQALLKQLRDHYGPDGKAKATTEPERPKVK